MKLPILLVLAAVPAISTPAAAQSLPFEGTWGWDNGVCFFAFDLSPDRPAPVILTRRGLTTNVLTCDFASVDAATDEEASYRIAADCTAGSRRGAEAFRFTVAGEFMRWDWSGQSSTFTRCPD